MKQRPHLRVWLIGVGLATLLCVAALGAQNYSRARIVRLSFVEGTVTVQRPDVAEWAQAPVNTPLQEGFKLSTAENSFAEVEFENASTVRLGQFTQLDFTQLGLLPSGAKLNRLSLQQGYATFHAIPEGEDVYEVSTPNGTLTPRGKAIFRVDLDSGEQRVEVSKGSVGVSSSLGSWTLEKNAVLELHPGSDPPYDLTQGITQDAWDEWVAERESRGQTVANAPAAPGVYASDMSDAQYGWSDLDTYGLWSYFPGFGYGWIPSVGYGWSPYSFGRWCWYPGFGPTWISYDPWGWLPFHYGGWMYMGGLGWAWFPGDFGFWSPGLVNWYAGPGWVGWVPVGPTVNGSTASPCPAGNPCGTAVKTHVFVNGGPVRPGYTVPWDPVHARRVESPGVQPELGAKLPGPIVATAARLGSNGLASQRAGTIHVKRMDESTASTSSSGVTTVETAQAASAANAASRFTGVAPGRGIVFDPMEGRYVNSNAAKAQSGPRDVAGESLPASGATQTPGAAFERGPANSAGPATQARPSRSLEARPAPAPQHERSGGWFHNHFGSGASSRSSSSGKSEGGFSNGGSRSGGGESSGASRSGGGVFSGSSGTIGGGGGSTGGGGHAGGGSSGGGHH
jgi:uncharacterized protein DUF6600/FecR-like protein